jgi:hypothetical protein
MAETILTLWAKGTRGESGVPRYSQNWALSRRGRLMVYADYLQFGDWVIAYRDITEAILYNSRQMFIPVYILAVTAGGHSYQFGLNPWAFWRRQLPFPVRRERVRLGYSPFSVVLRVLMIGLLIYFVWHLFR